VAHANGEFGEYNNHITLFNERFLRFSAWYAGRYRPADGEAAARLYYLSAYGIALKHGFAGSEEAWLESLKGDPFTYEDFTPEQLQALVPKKGVDYLTPEEIGEAAGTAADAAAVAVMQSTEDKAKQAEEAANAAKLDADRAEEARDKSPVIGENGNWFVWNAAAGDYVDSGVGAAGPAGPEGPKGDTGAAGPRGLQGLQGPRGYEGVSVTRIVQVVTSGPGESNLVRVFLSDGSSYDLTTQNGDTGPAGPEGYTPVKGTDYWTPADKQEIVAATLAALPKAEEASF